MQGARALGCTVGLIAFGAACLAAARPPDSPVAWQPLPGAPAESIPETVETALASILPAGAACPTPRRVVFSDRCAFGEDLSGAMWLLSVPDVVVAARDQERVADVALRFVVREDTGSLVAAFTDPLAQWPERSRPPLDADAAAGIDQWSVEPLGTEQLRSTAAEILGGLWTDFGVAPDEAGQIVLRPRWATTPWAHRRPSGEIVPPGTWSPKWIVEVIETARHRSFCQGMTCLYEDGTNRMLRTLFDR